MKVNVLKKNIPPDAGGCYWPFRQPDNGFKIDPTSFSITGGFIDFDILAGTMYTGGLRLEMDNTEKFRLQKIGYRKTMTITNSRCN